VITSNNIDNTVVLTGDIHTSWANDLPGDNYDANTGDGSVGVEFVVTSISTTSSPINIGQQIIQLANPHMKFIDLSQKGYLILDLTHDKAQSDWYYVSDITQPDFTSSWGAGFYTNNGDNHLSEANAEAPAGVYPPLAPLFDSDQNVGLSESTDPLVLSAYPNPFLDRFVVQMNLFEAERMQISLIDAAGKTVLQEDLGQQRSGLHYLEVNAGNIPAGVYVFSLRTENSVVHRRMLKVNR
jgi:alkaline phosphatase D